MHQVDLNTIGDSRMAFGKLTQPGTNIRDDGSYVRIIRKLEGKNHNPFFMKSIIKIAHFDISVR